MLKRKQRYYIIDSLINILFVKVENKKNSLINILFMKVGNKQLCYSYYLLIMKIVSF